MRVYYSANNSGGDWWLSPGDWLALEAAGWTVEWREFLGSPAQGAHKEFPSVARAVQEWQAITGQDADATGCECCGQPHNFFTL